jgi:hypothetical protein
MGGRCTRPFQSGARTEPGAGGALRREPPGVDTAIVLLAALIAATVTGRMTIYESTEIICPEADMSIDRLSVQNFKKFVKKTFVLHRLRERGGNMQC